MGTRCYWCENVAGTGHSAIYDRKISHEAENCLQYPRAGMLLLRVLVSPTLLQCGTTFVILGESVCQDASTDATPRVVKRQTLQQVALQSMSVCEQANRGGFLRMAMVRLVFGTGRPPPVSHSASAGVPSYQLHEASDVMQCHSWTSARLRQPWLCQLQVVQSYR